MSTCNNRVALAACLLLAGLAGCSGENGSSTAASTPSTPAPEPSALHCAPEPGSADTQLACATRPEQRS